MKNGQIGSSIVLPLVSAKFCIKSERIGPIIRNLEISSYSFKEKRGIVSSKRNFLILLCDGTLED